MVRVAELCEYTKKQLNSTLWINFMIWQLHFNKTYLKKNVGKTAGALTQIKAVAPNYTNNYSIFHYQFKKKQSQLHLKM